MWSILIWFWWWCFHPHWAVLFLNRPPQVTLKFGHSLGMTGEKPLFPANCAGKWLPNKMRDKSQQRLCWKKKKKKLPPFEPQLTPYFRTIDGDNIAKFTPHVSKFPSNWTDKELAHESGFRSNSCVCTILCPVGAIRKGRLGWPLVPVRG